MNDLSVCYRRVIEEIVSQRVPLVYLESTNGHFVPIVTASGVAVLTLSRTTAILAGIGPDSEFFESHSKRMPRAIARRAAERCTSRPELCMPSIEPVPWAHPDTALDALKPLLDRCGGRVENVIVQRCAIHISRHGIVSDTSWPNMSFAMASACSSMRISANMTADFGNVTDSAGLGVARCRL